MTNFKYWKLCINYMEKNNISLSELLSSIENNVVAITADETLASQGTILLTLYPDSGSLQKDLIEDVDTVEIEGIPAQLMTQTSFDGISTLDQTIVYLRENTSTILQDGTEVTSKSLQKGLDEIQERFFESIEDSIIADKEEALDTTGKKADTKVLKEHSENTTPQKVFTDPHGDIAVEIYKIGGTEYALYFDGGVYEAYRSSTASPTMSGKLSESDYWQRGLA